MCSEEERQAAASKDSKTMRRHWVMRARDLRKELPFTSGSDNSSKKRREGEVNGINEETQELSNKGKEASMINFKRLDK